MRHLEDLKSRLKDNWGIRWSDSYGRLARQEMAKHPADPDAAAARLLNGETYFFRYPVYLQVLRDHLKASAARGVLEYRILSAGCSTGEEAYSLAFALAEDARAAGSRLEVIGVDVRPEAIHTAHKGEYKNWSLRNRNVEGLDRFLSWTGTYWRVAEPYKRMVRFQVQNLLEPIAAEKVHAIVSCNVLLYMHDAAVQRVYGNLQEVLAEKGILLIAPTDPPPHAPWKLLASSAGWPVFSWVPGFQEPAVVARALPVPPKKKPRRAVSHRSHALPAHPVAAPPVDSAVPEMHADETSDRELWSAWARGELSSAAEKVRQKLFFEPDQPLWRFLNGVILRENGWLRKSSAEIRKAGELLQSLPGQTLLKDVCTVEELQRVIDFWRQQHG